MVLLMYFLNPCRVFDVHNSDLLKHWDDTYKFIKEAKYVVSICACVCARVCVCMRTCVYMCVYCVA